MRRLAALIAILLAGTAGATDIYIWKDREGRTNYADNPPHGDTPIRTIGSRGGVQPPAEAAKPDKAAPTAADQELEFRKRRGEAADKQAAADKSAAEAAEKRRNCERARNQLAALESGQRVARYNASGEREFLDDAQRTEEIAATRKAVDSWCK